MSDRSGPMTVRSHHPGARGDRMTGRLLEGLVHTMVAMEAGRRPVFALDPLATPLAARRIQRIVLGARAERRGRPAGERRRTAPVRVRTVASFHPTAGVTEGVVLVRHEQRTRAYCVRLEQCGSQWRLVELAPPDKGLRPVVTATSRAGRLVTDTERHAERLDGRRRGLPIDGVGRDRSDEHDGRDDGSGLVPAR